MKFPFPVFFALTFLATAALRAQVAADADSDTQPPPGSTLITSDELNSDQVKHQSVFTGKVVVVGQNFHMTCQEMTVFFNNDNKVSKIIATGDVVITQPNRVTHCGHAEYYQDTDTFDLTQEPVILDHNDQVSGPEIIVDRKSQTMKVKGPRSKVIIPNSNMGSATTTPSATGPAAPAPNK